MKKIVSKIKYFDDQLSFVSSQDDISFDINEANPKVVQSMINDYDLDMEILSKEGYIFDGYIICGKLEEYIKTLTDEEKVMLLVDNVVSYDMDSLMYNDYIKNLIFSDIKSIDMSLEVFNENVTDTNFSKLFSFVEMDISQVANILLNKLSAENINEINPCIFKFANFEVGNPNSFQYEQLSKVNLISALESGSNSDLLMTMDDDLKYNCLKTVYKFDGYEIRTILDICASFTNPVFYQKFLCEEFKFLKEELFECCVDKADIYPLDSYTLPPEEYEKNFQNCNYEYPKKVFSDKEIFDRTILYVEERRDLLKQKNRK